MKKKLFAFFVSILVFASLWGQINSKNFIQVSKFSLLDPNLKILLNNDLQKFKKNISHIADLYTENHVTDITKKYFDINNSWFYIHDYGLVQKSNSNIIFPTSGRDSDNNLQLLNDTLLLMQDGSILNLNSRKLLYDTIANRFSKIILNLNHWNQLSADKNNIILSDILFSDFDRTPNSSYKADIVFNLFKDSARIKDVGGYVNNNPNSKYILTGRGFINRFDINDFVDFNSYGDDYLNYAYNDSLVYFSIKMDGIFKLLKIPLNENLKDSITLNDIDEDFNNSLLRNISDKIIDYSSVGDDRKRKVISTYYFHKKYNSIELSISDLIENPNYFNTFNSLLTYDPILIVEYNYITKRVLSILDGEVYPFQSKVTPRSISRNKLFLDNSNRYLIIQQQNDVFAIFDLEKKKEIVTLSGIISGVNYNNELLINIAAKSAVGTEYGNYVGIIQTKLDLNELYNLTESNYVPDNNGKLKFDEFTSKTEFNYKLDSCLNKKNNISSFPTQFHPFPKKNVHSRYSNDFISKNISSTINRFYDTLYNNIGNMSLIYPLKYYSYSNETKDFTFIAEDEQSLPQIDDSRQFTYGGGYKTDYSIIDSSFKHDFKVSYNTITISDVSLQEAKEFRNGKYFFKKRSYLSNNFEIPSLKRFFIFKYFSKIHKSEFKDSGSEIPIQDKILSNQYFNYFVPFDSTLVSNYNEWLFGTKDKFFKIGKVDYP